MAFMNNTIKKHKHCDIATKWFNNTNLIILSKSEGEDWEIDLVYGSPEWNIDVEYILVPEIHTQIALYWLNGGDIEMLVDFPDSTSSWMDTISSNGNVGRLEFHVDFEFRKKAKVRNVRVWIGTQVGIAATEFDIFKGNLDDLLPSHREKYTWTEVTVDQLIRD
jgi:hypothetical protein